MIIDKRASATILGTQLTASPRAASFSLHRRYSLARGSDRVQSQLHTHTEPSQRLAVNGTSDQPNWDDMATVRPHALTHPARPEHEHMAGQCQLFDLRH
jgi:hypothetical protein